MIELNPRLTALVLIDVQNSLIGRKLEPTTADQLVARCHGLAQRFRAAKATVVLVNVAFSADGADMLRQPVDEAMPMSPGGLPPGWNGFPAGLYQPGDLVITKRQWGAFYGTELDLQLRRRGIRTIVLGGVATQIGVESTARQAYERGYELILAADMTTSTLAEAHDMSMKHIMPRLARLLPSADFTLRPP